MGRSVKLMVLEMLLGGELDFVVGDDPEKRRKLLDRYGITEEDVSKRFEEREAGFEKEATRKKARGIGLKD